MLNYGPQTAADKQPCNLLDISAMKMISEAKILTPYQHQMCRPELTSPYKLAETAEKILVQIIGLSQTSDPLLRQTADELIAHAAKTAMSLAKALHDEFRKYEDEIEKAATAKASIRAEQTELVNTLYKKEST